MRKLVGCDSQGGNCLIFRKAFSTHFDYLWSCCRNIQFKQPTGCSKNNLVFGENLLFWGFFSSFFYFCIVSSESVVSTAVGMCVGLRKQAEAHPSFKRKKKDSSQACFLHVSATQGVGCSTLFGITQKQERPLTYFCLKLQKMKFFSFDHLVF